MSEELRPISYAGFSNMVQSLLGSSMDVSPLANRKLASVEVTEGKRRLVFHFEDGNSVAYQALGDCCSESWIEHLTVPPDIAGSEITAWAQQDMGETEQDFETIRVYQTSFVTPKGEIIVEYRNSSNGYYGGWLEGPV